jgi:hypothetical protein
MAVDGDGGQEVQTSHTHASRFLVEETIQHKSSEVLILF